jgi:hypothetical protein
VNYIAGDRYPRERKMLAPQFGYRIPWIRRLPIVTAAALLWSIAGAQTPNGLPFAIGEKFTYTGHTERFGAMGHGEMWIEGPVPLRGVSTWLLRFDFRAGLGPLGGSDRSSSWIDASDMTSLRYEKHARRFLSGSEEVVEVFPDEQRWTAADGTSGDIVSGNPLDELSFIYFIRTLPLAEDSLYVVDRHFDVARTPTVIRVAGRETIATKAGTFNTIKVEMVVKDKRNFEKEGIIRFFFSDDIRRIPVRIESEMPGVGLATLTLESHNIATADSSSGKGV